MSIVAWITILLSIAGLIAVVRIAQRRTGGPLDHGSVSEHWVSEHRASQPGDRQR